MEIYMQETIFSQKIRVASTMLWKSSSPGKLLIFKEEERIPDTEALKLRWLSPQCDPQACIYFTHIVLHLFIFNSYIYLSIINKHIYIKQLSESQLFTPLHTDCSSSSIFLCFQQFTQSTVFYLMPLFHVIKSSESSSFN